MVQGRLNNAMEKFPALHIFSVNSIKSLPPLKVNNFKYHEVKAFCDPQRRKYSLWEHVEPALLLSDSEEALLPERQSLDKPNLREMGQKKRTHSSHATRSFRGSSTVGKPGLPGCFEIKPGFLKPENIHNTVKKQRQSTAFHIKLGTFTPLPTSSQN